MISFSFRRDRVISVLWYMRAGNPLRKRCSHLGIAFVLLFLHNLIAITFRCSFAFLLIWGDENLMKWFVSGLLAISPSRLANNCCGLYDIQRRSDRRSRREFRRQRRLHDTLRDSPTDPCARLSEISCECRSSCANCCAPIYQSSNSAALSEIVKYLHTFEVIWLTDCNLLQPSRPAQSRNSGL